MIIFECALALAGCGFLVWYFFVPSGRAARARPPALAKWDVSVSDVLFLAWIILAAGLLGQFLLQATVGHALSKLPEGSTIEQVVYGSTFHVGAILAWIVAHSLARRHRLLPAPPEVPQLRVSPLQTLLSGILTFLAVIPLATGAALAWERFLEAVGLPTERQELVDFFVQTKSPVLLALMIGLALVVAPIIEELVFRAGLFRYLRSRPPVAIILVAAAAAAVFFLVFDSYHRSLAGVAVRLAAAAGICLGAFLLSRDRRVRQALLQPTPRWVAFTVSAGLFAMLHGNWVSALPLFVLGLVFAAAYERTGRLAVPMLAHAFFNLNTLLLVLSGVGR